MPGVLACEILQPIKISPTNRWRLNGSRVKPMANAQSRASWTCTLFVAIVAPGCSCVDGSYVYHVRGHLVDMSSGRSVSTHNVRVQSDPISDRASGWWQTAESGDFQIDMRTGLKWGGCYMIFRPHAPQPPALSEVNILAEGDRSGWQTLKISKRQQSRAVSGERWVDLSTIRVEVGNGAVN